MTTERFTDAALKILELALREALSLGHSYVDTEHLLLAVCRYRDSTAGRMLAEIGVTMDMLNEQLQTAAVLERGCVCPKGVLDPDDPHLCRRCRYIVELKRSAA